MFILKGKVIINVHKKVATRTTQVSQKTSSLEIDANYGKSHTYNFPSNASVSEQIIVDYIH